MQMIHIDDHVADLRAVEQGLLGSFGNVSLDMCAIVDRWVVTLTPRRPGFLLDLTTIVCRQVRSQLLRARRPLLADLERLQLQLQRHWLHRRHLPHL